MVKEEDEVMIQANPSASLPAHEPTWEIARLFPDQGSWSEEEYLALNANRLLEFSHGYLDVLPMPTLMHQQIVFFLVRLIASYVEARKLGHVLCAPLRVQLWPGKYREPDIVFMLETHTERKTAQCWIGADLVVEVVSNDDRRRDLEVKRFEYARAGIPEYWIIDPQEEQIIVLKLDDGKYSEHGKFKPGTRASSVLLAGLEIEVTAVLKAN